MLVLSRKKNQEIVIILSGSDGKREIITIKIADIRPGEHESDTQVRVGIEAPTKYAIHRMEVYESILAEGALPKTGSCPSGARAVENSRSATGPNPSNRTGRSTRFGR